METSIAQIGNVVGHHSANDIKSVGQMALEYLDVADAILEADNGRAGPSVGGNFLRGIFGRAAFHAQRNDAGIGKGISVDPIIDLAGRQRPLPAVIVADGQAVLADIVRDAFSSDETNVEPGRLPASADEAADRSGAKYSDLGQPRPL
jgi:hypothetical protein